MNSRPSEEGAAARPSLARAGKLLAPSDSGLHRMIRFGIATLVWFAVLAKSPLSLVYPLMSLSYVFGLVLARYCLGESISLVRWAGVGLICVGVALVTR